MAEDNSPGFERWWSLGTTIIAPVTLLSTLLFYFGYVSSRAQFEYFGVDVDTIGLSTQDYVMRSPQPLLVPVLLLTLLGIGALLLHTFIVRQIGSAPTERDGGELLERYRLGVRAATISGVVLLVAGVALLFSYTFLREWALFALVTPVTMAVGAALFAYASRLRSRLIVARTPQRPPDPSVVRLRRAATALIVVAVIANTFWATATVAQWSGRGLAHYQAQHLNRLPSVILDTKERLYLRSPGVEETVLPNAAGQEFHYRYRHLRLLIQGHDRMFLVPDTWTASNSTLIVPLDESVRVQFQFQNEAP